jgi:hypothetical protein
MVGLLFPVSDYTKLNVAGWTWAVFTRVYLLFLWFVQRQSGISWLFPRPTTGYQISGRGKPPFDKVVQITPLPRLIYKINVSVRRKVGPSYQHAGQVLSTKSHPYARTHLSLLVTRSRVLLGTLQFLTRPKILCTLPKTKVHQPLTNARHLALS